MWIKMAKSQTCESLTFKMYTGCPHKKYTEIKINVMAKLLYIYGKEKYISRKGRMSSLQWYTACDVIDTDEGTN